MPAMTWLLVTTTPSGRTMTPEPTEPTCWARGPWPNIDQNGSWTRRTPRAEMLTTAGAAVRTTGAKLAFIANASPGMTRFSANTPSCARVSSG